MREDNSIVSTVRPAFQYKRGLPDRRERLRAIKPSHFVKFRAVREADPQPSLHVVNLTGSEWKQYDAVDTLRDSAKARRLRKIDEPVAEHTHRPYRIGFLKGQISVPDDFDTMFQAEIEAMFEG